MSCELSQPRGSRWVTRVAGLLLLGTTRVAGAQTAPVGSSPDREPLTVRWNVPEGQFIDRHTPLEFSLNRALEPDEGQIALIVGSLDVTDVAERTATTLVYRPRMRPLPSGEQEVVVYRRAGREWTEVRRFPLKVLTRAGLVRASVSPNVAIGATGQVAEGHSSGAPAPERSRFQDVTLASGIRSSHQGATWSLETQGNMTGASRQEQALRFAERGRDAPRIDLADYGVTLTARRTRVALGHVTLGDHRHLTSGFASRGVTLTNDMGPTKITFGAVNGTPVVGWNNPVGLDRPAHRVLSVALASELLPLRPGALHAGVSVLNGSLLPEQSFSQGAVVDAERSKGLGVQLSASTPGQRVRLSTGFSRSRFTNPARDRELSGDSTIVPVAAETRNARYADAEITVLQQSPVRGVPVTLATAYHHERVDPLYRTVAASLQADREQHTFDVNGSAGVVAAQLAHTRTRNNLDDVPSVLRSLDRQSSVVVTVGLPTARRLARVATYLPTLSLNLARTHQFAAAVPTNGDFRPQDIPDQVSKQAEAGAQWQTESVQLSYRYSQNDQDNRGPQRERADFATRIHTLSVGRPFGTRGDVSAELSAERQHAVESDATNRVRRVGMTGNWRPLINTGIAGSMSTTLSGDASRADGSRNIEARFEVSQSVLRSRVQSGDPRGQLFLRYAITSARLRTAESPDSRSPFETQRVWSLSTGLNLRVF